MQKRTTTTILTLVTIASVIAALYFGVQNMKIKNIQKTKLKAEDAEVNFEQQKTVSSIDSLLMQGNYKKALSLSRDLKASGNMNIDPALNLRFKIAKDFIELSKRTSIAEAKKDNNKLLDSTKKLSGAIVNDTRTQLELKQAKLEIKKLKNRLTRTSASDYITFKTSKGTSLHYVGNVENGKANGYGIAILETGSRYEGQWKDNLRHGQGKFYWNDGEDYEGEYRNDMREGFGIYHWGNGEKYVGEWKNDRRNGEGEFYNKRGKLKTKGIWEDDELVEEN